MSYVVVKNAGASMDQHVDARVAAADLDRILDAVTTEQSHIYLDRAGRDPVVVISLAEFRRLCPATDWLTSMQNDSEARGVGPMTMDETDAEIAAYRAEKAAEEREL